MRSFATTDRFAADMAARKLRPAYVLVGDEGFFRRRCRDAILEHLVSPSLRDFSLHEFDLAETPLQQVLDNARTPSLMAPFQVFFLRNVKALYGRGKQDDKFEALADYLKNPNPDALLVFIADHISIPADVRRMELQDRERFERLRETLGEHCAIIELARVEESDAVRWAVETAAAQPYMLAKTFRQMLVILEKNVRDSRAIWQALWQGFRLPPFAAEDVIKQARRYKSRRELTQALRLIARADMALRSNPPSKRMVLENLVLALARPARPEAPAWAQEELPVI